MMMHGSRQEFALKILRETSVSGLSVFHLKIGQKNRFEKKFFFSLFTVIGPPRALFIKFVLIEHTGPLFFQCTRYNVGWSSYSAFSVYVVKSGVLWYFSTQKGTPDFKSLGHR
jgi:hypothetical protein